MWSFGLRHDPVAIYIVGHGDSSVFLPKRTSAPSLTPNGKKRGRPSTAVRTPISLRYSHIFWCLAEPSPWCITDSQLILCCRLTFPLPFLRKTKTKPEPGLSSLLSAVERDSLDFEAPSPKRAKRASASAKVRRKRPHSSFSKKSNFFPHFSDPPLRSRSPLLLPQLLLKSLITPQATQKRLHRSTGPDAPRQQEPVNTLMTMQTRPKVCLRIVKGF